jgi:DNA mismatch repair protein MutL
MNLIKKLDENVIRLISAGEIIHRPINAIKELIENSIDAGATKIIISIYDNGLKSISINDNGIGISPKNFPMVCERFSTSKLDSFKDLENIKTFGFRGEALASISSVSRIQLTSKTIESEYAHEAKFVNCTLSSDILPLPWVQNHGTQIDIYDLFYNLPTRRQFLLNEQREEFKCILSLIQAFALNFFGKVSFVFYKDTAFTSSKQPFFVSDKDYKELVCSIVKPNCFSDLIKIQYEGNIKESNFKIDGLISSQKHYSSEIVFHLFINDRLVDFKKLKANLKKVYQDLYLTKNRFPFLFISLQLESFSIDVNYHPSKREVLISESDLLIRKIEERVEMLVKGQNQEEPCNSPSIKVFDVKTESSKNSKFKLYSDPKLQTIDLFLYRNQNLIPEKRLNEIFLSDYIQKEETNKIPVNPSPKKDSLTIFDSSIDCEFLYNSTYIGCLDNKRILLQHGLGLFEIDMIFLSSQYFYHILLARLHSDNLELKEINYELDDTLKEAFDVIEIDPEMNHSFLLEETKRKLQLNSSVLLEFGFSFDWNNFILKTVPKLSDSPIVPTKKSIGIILTRISLEYSCQNRTDLLKEIVFCYTFLPEVSEDDISLYFKHYLFPQLKALCVKGTNDSKKAIINSEYKRKILDIPTLFKYFERC